MENRRITQADSLARWASGLGASGLGASGPDELVLWLEVSGLREDQASEARRTLERELGARFQLRQGLRAAGGGSEVALVPLLGALNRLEADRTLAAIAYRIRAAQETKGGPARLVFVELEGEGDCLPSDAAWLRFRQSLEKSLEFQPAFLGRTRSGNKNAAQSATILEKKLRALEGVSKTLLDWFTGDTSSSSAVGSLLESRESVEEEPSLQERLACLLYEEWGLAHPSSSSSHEFSKRVQHSVSG